MGHRQARAADADALAILSAIQARHLPYGTILDPIFVSPTSDQIKGYTRCGDSALWTGTYLAAEAFRYQVTRAPDALTNVKNAIQGLKTLVDVTGTDVLARCAIPLNSPYAAGIQSEESANGIYTNSTLGLFWVGNTSRDEYTGVMFGLGVAYDMVNDSGVQTSISQLVTRLVNFLTANGWSVIMPDGSASTSFILRVDQMASFLQVAAHVNPGQFSPPSLNVFSTATLLAAIGVDVATNDSYFKFNLDFMNFYNLMRLDATGNSTYREAYNLLWNHVDSHQNAFFEMIDHALKGPDAARDAEALALLASWLPRSRRDQKVDDSTLVPVCGSEACQPVAVPLRPPDDFIWQVDPFQLSGGGDGFIENSGLDYILPYWMARSYSVTSPYTVQSSAAAIVTMAPGSIASLYGPKLAATTAQAGAGNLPESLGGVNLTVTDLAGNAKPADLYYVSPGQINFVVPQGLSPGLASFTVSGPGNEVSAPGTVIPVAPALYSADGSGTGVAAATAIRIQAGAPGLQQPVPVFECGTNGCVSVPIDLGIDTPVYLSLYGTGIRNRTSLANISVTINGVSVPVLYAGPQTQYAGLDQVNVLLPLSLRGSGETAIVLTADGQTSNTVMVSVQ